MISLPRLCAALVASAMAAVPAAGQAGDRPAPMKKHVRYGIALAPGDAAPAFGGVDLSGSHREIAYAGSVATVVGFWASQCVPCRLQSATLQKVFAERGGAGVQIVGVAVDALSPRFAPEEARAFLEEHGGAYPVLRSSPEIEKVWRGIAILPTTFLVGRDGKLVRRYMGADDAIVKGLLEDVEAYIAGKPLGDQPFPPSLDDPPRDSDAAGDSSR